jgi:hypothetical protein
MLKPIDGRSGVSRSCKIFGFAFAGKCCDPGKISARLKGLPLRR